MKKIISLVLALLLVFVLSACGDENTSSDVDKTISEASDTFVAPKDYATVVLVTVNPQFKLYLDSSGNVLAVEPINNDAKSIAQEIKALEGNIETVIDSIVTALSDGGFIEKETAATVNFEITEIKTPSVDTTTILEKITNSTNASFDKLEIAVEIKTSIANNNFSDTTSDSQNSDTTSDVSSDESSKTEESIPSHTHSFSAANCTEAKKCSCGVTEGAPLGHSYKDGKCIVCYTADPNYKLTAISSKNGAWSGEYIYNNKYYSAGLKLSGDLYAGVSIGDPLSEMEQEIQDDIRNNKDNEDYKDSYVVFDGKEYWCARGSGAPLASIVENGNTVTLTIVDETNATITLTRTNENTLVVESCTQLFKEIIEDIPVGTKFTFNAN